jgi:hypothetical protein
MRSKTLVSLVRILLEAWIVSPLSCVLVSGIDSGLAMGRSPVEGIVAKCLKGFIASGVNSELEQARRA